MKSLEELATIDRGNRIGELATLIRHFARAGGDPSQALATARTERAPQRVVDLLERAAVPGALGPELIGYNTIAAAFVDVLRSRSAFARMVADGSVVKLPFGTQAGAILSGVIPATTLPGGGIPVGRLELSGAMLERAAPTAESVITRSLSAAIAAAVDAAVFASLIAGAPAATPATASVLGDLRALLTTLAPGAASRIYLVADTATVITMATIGTTAGRLFPDLSPSGGTVLGVPLLASDGLPAATIVAVDTTRVAGALDPIEIFVSEQASLELDDSPSGSINAGSPSAPVHTNQVSLFQTNSVGIRGTQGFGVEVLAPGGVLVLNTIVGW